MLHAGMSESRDDWRPIRVPQTCCRFVRCVDACQADCVLLGEKREVVIAGVIADRVCAECVSTGSQRRTWWKWKMDHERWMVDVDGYFPNGVDSRALAYSGYFRCCLCCKC
jgi:hypothetical protein